MHKSVDVALLQEKMGGACGVCCQKVSEAEVFARGGIKDVLVSNQVRDPRSLRGWLVSRCWVPVLLCALMTWPTSLNISRATEAGTKIECLVEIDCALSGVTTTQAVVDIAVAIDA